MSRFFLTRLELNVLLDTLKGSLSISDGQCLLFRYTGRQREELCQAIQKRMHDELLFLSDQTDAEDSLE
jgi:hypothetical protein